MNAFVTGSRAYGKESTNETDIDLVVLCDNKTADLLRSLSELSKEPVRFGKLNLILCADEEEYACWRVATSGLVEDFITSGPISKEEAITRIDKVFAQAGLPPRRGVS